MDYEKNDFNYKIKKDIDNLFNELSLSNKAKEMFYRLSDFKIHSLKITKTAESVAKKLGYSKSRIKSLKKSSIMHDVGKINIDDWVFLSEEKFTKKQKEKYINPHVKFTKNMLEDLNEFTEREIKIAYQHHESLNGKGYPQGLKEQEILEEAKILKACDMFESITADRTYSPADTIAEAKDIMLNDLTEQNEIDPEIAKLTCEEGAKVYKEYIEKAIVNTNLKKLKNDPRFKKAKNGDLKSAKELVKELVNDERLKQIKKETPKDTIILPVMSQEKGKNMIPKAYAELIADKTNYKIADNIFKIKKSDRKSKGGLQRLLNRNMFVGKVDKGKNYLLIDDVVTQGGTLRDLKDYIESMGGNVEKYSTVSYSRFSTYMNPSVKTIKKIKNNLGKDNIENYLQKYNIANNLKELTSGEARYIARYTSMKSLKEKTKEIENVEPIDNKDILRKKKGEYMSRIDYKEIANKLADDVDNVKVWNLMKNFKENTNLNNYSVSNNILLASQKDGSVYVRGFKQWSKEGFKVKKGSKSLKIYAPIFRKEYSINDWKKIQNINNINNIDKKIKQLEKIAKAKGKENNINKLKNATKNKSEYQKNLFHATFKKHRQLKGYRKVHVFDISDTEPETEEAKEKKKKIEKALTKQIEKAKNKTPEVKYKEIKKALENKGYEIKEKNLGTALGGSAFHKKGNKKAIRLNSNNSENQKLGTLLHEYAHHELKHLTDKREVDSGVKELEAESSAYMLAKSYNYEITNSDEYIKSHVRDMKREDVIKNIHSVIGNVEKMKKSLDKEIEKTKNKSKEKSKSKQVKKTKKTKSKKKKTFGKDLL